MVNIKRRFKSIQSRYGTYSVGMIVVVAVVAIVLNLIAAELPEGARNIDLSSQNLYGISKTSKKMLKDLEKDVEFTVLAEKETIDNRIETFLTKYTGLSDNITVSWVDPVAEPAKVQEYDAASDSIVVSCEETGKTTTISFDEIIVYDMSSYYMTGSAEETKFDGDGQFTSAVNYVTSEKTNKIYRTSGHGEGTFSTSISDMMEKSNYTVEETNLLMEDSVPEDCELLIIYAPTSDIARQEKEMIEDYMNAGGNVYIILPVEQKDMPNLEALMQSYGLQKVNGYIADMERSYQGNYYLLFPNISASGSLGNNLDSDMVLLANATGMTEVEELDDAITVTAFLNTSEHAYAVTEEEQAEGTYILGAISTKTSGNEEEDAEEGSDTDKGASNTTSRLTVIGSESLIDASVTDSFSNLSNTTLFLNSVSENFDGVQSVAIEPKSLSVQYNTAQHAGVIGLTVIFGIPILVVASGFVVWLRRRRA